MKKEICRDRVKGFLSTQGRKIVNEEGQEVILTGWGLGNWLLAEGYMWRSYGCERFDRPRRIEAVLEELAGREYADLFWQQFRANYITEADIQLMAQQGYNSVRIPINYRLFMEDGPGLKWKNEGFELLDNCIDWCEKHRLYAFIDLHGAPGGQTGANIDDCIDDVARLFTDQDNFDKGIALWENLSHRYKDRWIVGGYDLLNEPLRPVRKEGDIDLLPYLPRLQEFYEKAIAAIRKADTRHLISLEGHHWASATDIFCKKYDPQMVIHFHRYGCVPDVEAYRPFLEVAERWDSPLWLGETGENHPEWYTAMYPLAVDLGIGYNLWPWKKMECVNSPCSIDTPEGWDEILDYTWGGKHPGFERSRRILDKYLENMKLENCTMVKEVTSSVLRMPGCVVRGTDFDEFPGKGVSFSGLREEENLYGYRSKTGMAILNRFPEATIPYGFDSRWNRFVLELAAGEFACYSLYDITDLTKVDVSCYSQGAAKLCVYQDDSLLDTYDLGKVDGVQIISDIKLSQAGHSVIRLEVKEGTLEVEKIATR